MMEERIKQEGRGWCDAGKGKDGRAVRKRYNGEQWHGGEWNTCILWDGFGLARLQAKQSRYLSLSIISCLHLLVNMKNESDSLLSQLFSIVS